MDRTDYIEFPTNNRDASGRFFSQAFGWTLIHHGPTYAGLEGAGIDGGIDAGPNQAAAPLAIIRTADLDDAERRVAARAGSSRVPNSTFRAAGASTSASPEDRNWPCTWRRTERRASTEGTTTGRAV